MAALPSLTFTDHAATTKDYFEFSKKEGSWVLGKEALHYMHYEATAYEFPGELSDCEEHIIEMFVLNN